MKNRILNSEHSGVSHPLWERQNDIPLKGRNFVIFMVLHYLKKQSQFAAVQICVNCDLKGNYGNMPVCGLRKNKANRIVQRPRSEFSG
jgi:hypothetical protein